MVDIATVYDNTKIFRQVAVYKNGIFFEVDDDLPEWFKRVMNFEK
jgi:hypothetical protein